MNICYVSFKSCKLFFFFFEFYSNFHNILLKSYINYYLFFVIKKGVKGIFYFNCIINLECYNKIY